MYNLSLKLRTRKSPKPPSMFQWDIVRPNTREGGQNVLKTFNVTGGRHEHNYRSFYFMSLDLFSLTFKNIFLAVLRERSPLPRLWICHWAIRHYTYTRLGLISMTVGRTSHLSLYSLSLGLLYCISSRCPQCWEFRPTLIASSGWLAVYIVTQSVKISHTLSC